MWYLSLQPGTKPTPPTLEGEVLTTEPPGKSPYKMLKVIMQTNLVYKCGTEMSEGESVSRIGLFADRLLCLWNSLWKNTGVDCHSLLQGIIPPSRDHIQVSCITGRFFTIWATTEALPTWWSGLQRVGKLGQEREIGQNPQRFYLVGNNWHWFLVIGTQHLKQLLRTRNEWIYC